MKSSKKLYGISAAVLCAVNLILFLMFYIPIYVLELGSEGWDYFRYFFTEAVEFIIPPLASAVLFFGAVRDGTRSVLLRAAVLSLPRLVYIFPYYYLYETAYGNDWIESIFLSFLISIAGIIVMWLHLIVLLAVIYLTARALIVRELLSALPPLKREKANKELRLTLNENAVKALPTRLSDKGLFNLTLPCVAGVFAACFLEFIISMLTEIGYIISHLAEYGSFRSSELVYTISKFILIFLLLFTAHALCYGLLKLLTEEKNDDANIQTLGG